MLVWIIGCFLFVVAAVPASENYELYETIMNSLEKKLASDYNPHIHPNDDRGIGKAIVRVNLSIKNLAEIDDLNMEYSVEVTIQQTWKDRRLAFNNTQIPFVNLNRITKIWQPDTFFSNEKRGHVHKTVTPYMKISSDGTVSYTTTLWLKLSCPMNLRQFPMDQHMCYIRIASYAYTTDHLVYLWETRDATQMMQEVPQPQAFEVKGISVDYCSQQSISVEFSCLKVNIWLKRNFFSYLLQIYVPCSVMVFVSWLPFWHKKNAVLGRVLIDTILLLLMLIFIQSSKNSLPASAYLKAVDIWMYGSLAFILSSFIVVVLTNQSSTQLEGSSDNAVYINDLQRMSENNSGNEKSNTGKRIFKKTDFIFRILFPAAFMVFVCVYYYIVFMSNDD